MSNELKSQLARTRVIADELLDEKAKAVPLAISTIRGIEREVVASLGMTSLRGLANLGTGERCFYAARVRGVHPYRPYDLGQDKGEILVIAPNGQLAMYKLFRNMGVVMGGARSALDSDLLVEDLEPYVSTLGKVLTRHLELATERISTLSKISTLAETIKRAMEEAKG